MTGAPSLASIAAPSLMRSAVAHILLLRLEHQLTLLARRIFGEFEMRGAERFVVDVGVSGLREEIMAGELGFGRDHGRRRELNISSSSALGRARPKSKKICEGGCQCISERESTSSSVTPNALRL